MCYLDHTAGELQLLSLFPQPRLYSRSRTCPAGGDTLYKLSVCVCFSSADFRSAAHTIDVFQ